MLIAQANEILGRAEPRREGAGVGGGSKRMNPRAGMRARARAHTHTLPRTGNLLVTPDGRLALIDFGLCAVVPPEAHTHAHARTHARTHAQLRRPFPGGRGAGMGGRPARRRMTPTVDVRTRQAGKPLHMYFII